MHSDFMVAENNRKFPRDFLTLLRIEVVELGFLGSLFWCP